MGAALSGEVRSSGMQAVRAALVDAVADVGVVGLLFGLVGRLGPRSGVPIRVRDAPASGGGPDRLVCPGARS